MTDQYWLVILGFGLAWGTLCALIAGNKKRNENAWFVYGFLFGVFSLIYLCTLPVLTPEPESFAIANEPEVYGPVHAATLKAQAEQNNFSSQDQYAVVISCGTA